MRHHPTDFSAPLPPDWRHAFHAVIVVVCVTGCLILGMLLTGCASPPEVQILSASCEAEYSDDVVARVACEIEMLVDDTYAAASIETSMEEEPADRCVVGELRYAEWILGGLFLSPISAEECTGAPFGFGPANRPASTGARSAE